MDILLYVSCMLMQINSLFNIQLHFDSELKFFLSLDKKKNQPGFCFCRYWPTKAKQLNSLNFKIVEIIIKGEFADDHLSEEIRVCASGQTRKNE